MAREHEKDGAPAVPSAPAAPAKPDATPVTIEEQPTEAVNSSIERAVEYEALKSATRSKTRPGR